MTHASRANIAILVFGAEGHGHDALRALMSRFLTMDHVESLPEAGWHQRLDELAALNSSNPAEGNHGYVVQRVRQFCNRIILSRLIRKQQDLYYSPSFPHGTHRIWPDLVKATNVLRTTHRLYFIHLQRSMEDATLSVLRRGIVEDVSRAVREQVQAKHICSQQRRELEMSNHKFVVVSFEDLCAKPSTVAHALSHFLHLPETFFNPSLVHRPVKRPYLDPLRSSVRDEMAKQGVL